MKASKDAIKAAMWENGGCLYVEGTPEFESWERVINAAYAIDSTAQRTVIDRLKRDNEGYAGQQVLLVQRVEALSQRCDRQGIVIDGLVGALRSTLAELQAITDDFSLPCIAQANAAIAEAEGRKG